MGEEISEAWAGDNGVAFDGRVVEVFGFSDAIRYHVREVGFDLSEPDRKGRRRVRVGRNGGGAMFKVDAADSPAFEALFQRVDAARSSLGAGGG